MKEIVVLSGKGGTGKTSLTAAFATLAAKCVLCDADVDAADLHLLMQPQVEMTTEFMGGGLAEIDAARCTQCGKCRDVCRFGAISTDFVVDAISCEGCGVCVDLCPEKAIDFPIRTSGEWYISSTRGGPMVHARLGIAEENSGKLVSLVRQQARSMAETRGFDLIVTDGPPGIGCPVIASIGGATALVIVVEPTMSGLHDMDRVVDLAAHFRVPGMLCVNKYDLNPAMTAAIEERAKERNLILAGRIPFDPLFVEAMVEGKNILEFRKQSATAGTVREVWKNIIGSPVMNMAGIRDFSAVIQ